MNIIKNRKLYYTISLGIIIIGLVTMFVRGLNYGIDFTGGTSIQIKIGKMIIVDEAKEIVDEYDKEASIVHIGENKDEIMIRSKKDFTNDEINQIIDEFVKKYDIKKKEFQSEKFGPFMGEEIKKKALLSSAIAIVAMLIYISWRFEFKFAAAAIIALLHDVLVTFSVYSIFRIPVNSAFIAAILTILGYSINDTIVIFDRIREELKISPKKSLEEIINGSISKSLTRTINTSLTTLVAVLVFYIVGVEDVKILALPLIFGIIAGTYSSLFIASPLWYELNNKGKLKTKKA
ncbi:protein translocase subunit secF [Keratinibaculum paraultunense]|uniref:Protein-export membrane protein SecF n=1 Tax=Keratinibaculum paraultunense TaxID=1278232 RepID=A0A4R3KVB2_9FIRM|nr:protein translocase subunit SecF [Keratinibaculum paraultunense]QQY78759.1 protein translocase subunit SecF [Keratinibaculum paraultunense]TCS89561.1 protein translocase subunit secF [Keratinibaculum paraultunense]